LPNAISALQLPWLFGRLSIENEVQTMLARLKTFTLLGIDAFVVEVEVDEITKASE
jgi:hypothetical protein